MDNIYLQVIAVVMVALLILAWMFPDQKWLEPFRAKRPARGGQSREERDAEACFPSTRAAATGAAASAAPLAIETRMAANQRSFRRFSAAYAAMSILGGALLLLFIISILKKF